jgi:CheY-like chemotaxis protein
MSSQLGHGATVELLFPLSKSSPPAKPARETQTTAIVDMPKCILVVDDDVLVAESIAEMLSDLGHTVHVAYSGARALELIHAHTEIELVLTDHAMPGMTGTELASSIRKFKPNLPIDLGSGYAELPEGTDLQLPRLSKPYGQDDLRSLIASIISAK